MKQNERIIQMISKRYVEYLQALCGLIQNESKLTHLPKDKELYEPIIKKMNEKSLIKFLDRLQTLVELITEQFESKDFCQKSRLHSAYLISLFEDYSRIYTIYNYGVTIAISMFSTLSSRKKNDLINSFEFFCKFNSEFKTNAKILPLLLNIEYKIPEISEIDPDTLRKLKKQGSKTSRSNTIVQPSVRNKKQNQEINNEDEIEFDENDEPLPTRTQSVVYKTSTKSKPIKQSRIQVEEFNTNALDNLLLSDVPDKKRQTMNPKQLTNEFFDWDQEEQKQEEKDNIFEQAHDVDDFEEAPQDIDKLLFDPKISLESTQPKTGIRSTNSNIQSSEGRFSAMSNGFNNPFAMNQNPGYGMQYGGNQFYQGGYGNFQTSNMNRFSAPIAPNSYKFNY